MPMAEVSPFVLGYSDEPLRFFRTSGDSSARSWQGRMRWSRCSVPAQVAMQLNKIQLPRTGQSLGSKRGRESPSLRASLLMPQW